MIQANELRIGNRVRIWVANIDDTDKLTLIDWQVMPNDILSVYQHEQAGKKHGYEPVPLTPELLLKAGFMLSERTNMFTIILFGDTTLELDENSDEYNIFIRQISSESDLDLILFSIEARYIHQIQNLYFAITGTELTITL